MKKIILVISVAAILTVMMLSGCTARFNAVLPTSEQSDNMIVGAIQTTAVGNPIIRQDDLLIYPAFINENEIRFPETSYYSFSNLPAKSILKATYQLEDGSFYCVPASNTSVIFHTGWVPVPICLNIDPSGKLNSWAPCRQPGRQIDEEIFQKINFQKISVWAPGSKRKEILYNGKSKDTIKLAYREYIDDVARPAFYQDLNFDLAESKLIGFKGIQIEIIEATNSTIMFKVIKKQPF